MELFQLLKQKQQLLQELLRYIKEKSFQDEEEEIEKILAFVDKKQEYIDKLNEVEVKIKALPKADGNNMEVKAVIEENNSIIHSIATLEKKNIAIMNSLKDKLKQNLKGTKIQQQYAVSYNNYAMDIRGSRFDGKQ